MKNFIKISLLSLLLAFFGITYVSAADQLVGFRDLISRSWPGATSTHTFTFITTNAIPPNGSIKIVPEINDFIVPGGFDYTDVDLSVSNNMGGPYVDRELAAVADAVNDGINVVVGAQGEISIDLNSSTGIGAGEYISIELGDNATYGDIGDQLLLNPNATTSYEMAVYTYDDVGKLLDRGFTFIVVIDPVRMSGTQPKVRANGSPDGFLAQGTIQTIMSLTTSYTATCRYSIASGTDYDLMTDQFTNTGDNFHSVLLTDIVEEIHYYYFIRCQDIYSVNDMTDYVIDFMVKGEGENPDDEDEEGEEGGSGSGSSSGGSGSGSGGGGGGIRGDERAPGSGDYLPYPPLPGAPGVVIEGWAYPNVDVVVLKDGVEMGLASANSDAEFGAFLSIEVQGVYTFGIWANDSAQRRSKTYSTTFWIDEGTQTNLSDVILPPTIETNTTSLNPGDALRVFGQTVPSTTVESMLYLPGQESSAVIKRSITNTGNYDILYTTAGLAQGVYNLKVKTYIDSLLVSDYSDIIKVGVGETVEEFGECAGADLNGDGRVNITDFSILLYWWNSDNTCADQNSDGTVNIVDFSIMMYYWTG